ncbi:MAG: DivIVA domain-containing protein [bacterium]
MKLTPLDVKKQEFKKSFRGYDAVEVDAFLEMVSDELERLIGERKQLADEVLTLKTQLKDYQSVERTLQETLVSAQESIKESKENSNREAEMIIREAELKAEKVLESAKLRLAEMKNELVVVKAQKDSFARRLRHLLESQLDLIAVLELDDLGFKKYESQPRPAHTQPVPRPQAKPEFEAVDDALPQQPAASPAPEPGAVDVESPHGINWGRRRIDDEGEKHDDPEQEKNSRISDQLII